MWTGWNQTTIHKLGNPIWKREVRRSYPRNPLHVKKKENQDEHYLGRFPLRTEVQLQNRTSSDRTPITPEPDPQSADILFPKTQTQITNHPKPPHQDENYSVHAQNPLLQDRKLELFYKNYSLIHTENYLITLINRIKHTN